MTKTIKPFLLDKVTSANKITLIDKKEILLDDYNSTKVLNTFFSNILSGLIIPEYELLMNKISDPAFKYVGKCVTRYSNHTKILAIGEVCNNHSRLPIFFSKINEAEIPRETIKLETAKACQDTDIPTKTIKESVEIITDALLGSFNDSVVKSNFPFSFRKCKYNACI